MEIKCSSITTKENSGLLLSHSSNRLPAVTTITTFIAIITFLTITTTNSYLCMIAVGQWLVSLRPSARHHRPVAGTDGRDDSCRVGEEWTGEVPHDSWMVAGGRRPPMGTAAWLAAVAAERLSSSMLIDYCS